MEDKEIESLYPEFDRWVHKDLGYACSGGELSTIKLWYEFLGEKIKNMAFDTLVKEIHQGKTQRRQKHAPSASGAK